MAYQTRLAELTLRDLRRLHDAHKRLGAVFDAIQTTSVQGKPVWLHLVNEVDVEIEALFRKGVVGVINHARRGEMMQLDGDTEFIEHLNAVAQAVEAARCGAGEGEPATDGAAAGDLGGENQPATVGNDSSSPA